jgi:hypothetical protein
MCWLHTDLRSVLSTDPELRNRVRELPSLTLHAFGHVHGAHGAVEQDGVTFANVALMGHLGDLVQAPTVQRMTRKRPNIKQRCYHNSDPLDGPAETPQPASTRS